jgi:D-alanyl-lipoteichoic acid acyltransferase DltB (MBOAT superfamily)
MIFNSTSFIVFFIVVFLIYYFPIKDKTKEQNWLLLLASYFFYGYADWKMIPILLVATIIIFFIGIAVHKAGSSKKSSLFTILGVLTGLGLLFYFKYFNFFIASFSSLLNAIGLHSNIGTFNIIMPLGISFFTFKLISYVIEIHRGKIEPSKDFITFSTYIAFFPTILSGPIDRPYTFIPQLQEKRKFNYSLVVDGSRQILWGLFQKMVIADNLASVISGVWVDIPNQSGSVLFITAILYSIQMYTDFSGYSHIAIGIGKVLGFSITKNFNYPYFSRNVAEYWRNWHISLTSWLTDYVFMPLNIKFRNLGNSGIILAIIINLVLVGIWHGANWTFAVFGLYHGLLFIPLILSGSFFKKKKLKTNKYGLPTIIDSSKMVVTFLLVTLGLIIFRADNISQAWEYISGIFAVTIISIPFGLGLAKIPLLFSLLFFAIEWLYRNSEYPLAKFGIGWNRPLRYAMYYAIIIAIVIYGGTKQQFIYFQF